jgi:hypothetical protein
MQPDWEALKAPFTFDEVHMRPGPVSKKNPQEPKTKPLAYIDARNVMERLDGVLGPDNWQCDYADIGGRLVCTISVRSEEGWVSKSDGAGATQIEAEKGELSDAFKRAAVRWGIGRYLYEMDMPWVRLNPKWDKEIDPNEMPKLRRVYENMISGKAMPSGDVGADKTAKADYNRLLDTLNKCQTAQDLSDWKEMFSEDYRDLPEDYRESMRGECARKKGEIEALMVTV